jgi:hypothetical protein
MRLILNGVNGDYLRNVIEQASDETESVDAAVAYASDASLLFDWCWKHQILLRYWGRFDGSIPITVSILRTFLNRRSANFTCKLIRKFHPKVIWWKGYGAYIGSANLTGSAWWSNVEAGVFIPEAELVAAGHDLELEEFFSRIDEHSSPLTDELVGAIEKRAIALQASQNVDRYGREEFEKSPFVQAWGGFGSVPATSAAERKQSKFLQEWNSTLQTLRNIAAIVSRPENRPRWVRADAAPGAQADQFLHAHYYQRVGKSKAAVAQNHEKNHGNPDAALREAVTWWRDLDEAPDSEQITLDEWSPFIRERLAKDRIAQMTKEDFVGICQRTHAIRDHSRRVPDTAINLPPAHYYSTDRKAEALAILLWASTNGRGQRIAELLSWVLYGGSPDDVPQRIWEAASDPQRHIAHFGLSALGELVGWALPNDFPPRNGRTSKALRSLGYDVVVHS